MEVITKLDIELARWEVPAVVDVVQGESNTRVLELNLHSDGQPWPIPDGVTVSVGYRKPDGTKGLYTQLPDGSSAVSLAGNVARITLAHQVLTCAGLVMAVISFADGDQKNLATFPLRITVHSNPAVGLLPSADYYAGLGIVFIPEVSPEGVISWTNNGELPNPDPVNIKGPKPVKGVDYFTEAEKGELVADVLAALPDGDEVSY